MCRLAIMCRYVYIWITEYPCPPCSILWCHNCCSENMCQMVYISFTNLECLSFLYKVPCCFCLRVALNISMMMLLQKAFKCGRYDWKLFLIVCLFTLSCEIFYIYIVEAVSPHPMFYISPNPWATWFWHPWKNWRT